MTPLAAKYASRMNLKPWQQIPSDKNHAERFVALEEGIKQKFETCGNRIMVKMDSKRHIHVTNRAQDQMQIVEDFNELKIYDSGGNINLVPHVAFNSAGRPIENSPMRILGLDAELAERVRSSVENTEIRGTHTM